MIDYQNLVPMDAEAMANFISYRTEIEVTLWLISLLNLLAILFVLEFKYFIYILAFPLA